MNRPFARSTSSFRRPGRPTLRHLRTAACAAGTLVLLLGGGARAVDLSPEELHTRLKSYLPEIARPSETLTNGTDYLRSLAPWVLMEPVEAPAGPNLARSNIYPNQLGYVRIARVDPDLPGKLAEAVAALNKTQPLQGLILDLRSAAGTDFGSATAAAGLFAQRPLTEVKLGTESLAPASLPPRPSTTPLPLAVLVNRRTRGAAEVLAAAVRGTASPSVVIGAATAGQARSYKSVTLADGLGVRVAADAVTLPDGTPFPASGLRPDLAIAVPEEDEALYFADEYQRVAAGRKVVTDTSGRLNEAELIRRRRGLRPAGDTPPEPAPRAVQDPALARGLDLLESLAVEQAGGSGGNSR